MAIHSTAFSDGREIVGNQVRPNLVALIHHRPQLPCSWLDGERHGVAEASGAQAGLESRTSSLMTPLNFFVDRQGLRSFLSIS